MGDVCAGADAVGALVPEVDVLPAVVVGEVSTPVVMSYDQAMVSVVVGAVAAVPVVTLVSTVVAVVVVVVVCVVVDVPLTVSPYSVAVGETVVESLARAT